MNDFIVIVNSAVVAEQIANLLNKYNNLNYIYTTKKILQNNVRYLVEQGVVNGTQEVIGCLGFSVINNNSTKIRHICVHENFRRQNIANRLLYSAIQRTTTTNIFMNIRSDNYPSLLLAERNNFFILDIINKGSYNLVTVGRTK